jgi:hypothetical protein
MGGCCVSRFRAAAYGVPSIAIIDECVDDQAREPALRRRAQALDS